MPLIKQMVTALVEGSCPWKEINLWGNAWKRLQLATKKIKFYYLKCGFSWNYLSKCMHLWLCVGHVMIQLQYVSMSLIINGLYHSLDFVFYRGTKGDKAGHLKFTLWAPGGEVPSDRGACRPGQETGREAGQSSEPVVFLNKSTLFIFRNDDCQ